MHTKSHRDRDRGAWLTNAWQAALLVLALSGEAPAGPFHVEVRTVDAPEAFRATLESLTSDAAEVIPTRQSQRWIDRADLRSLVLRPTSSDTYDPPPLSPPPLQVLLTSGDWLAAAGVEIRDERLQLQRESEDELAPWDIPLEYVRAVVRSTADARRELETVREVLHGDYSSDVVLLANGDRLAGEFVDWQAGSCRFDAAGAEQAIPERQVRALVLDPALASGTLVEPSAARWALVMLRDGTRLSALDLQWNEDRWRIATRCGFTVDLPTDSVGRIDFFGEHVQNLAAIAATEYVHRPFLSIAQPHEVDRNAEGGPLQIGRQRYGWGLGVWSGARLAWDIPPGMSRFEATVGVDAAAEGRGSVDFVVLVDGVEQARSGRRTGSDPPLVVGPVAIQPGGRLELVVEYADRGDLDDFADWCLPVLLK